MAMPKGGTRTLKPTTLKTLAGTLNVHRHNPNEPTTHPGIPDAPPYLLPTEQESWERFANILHASMHVLTKEDFASFESMVCTYDEVRRLRHSLRASGTVICEEPKFNKAGEVVGSIIKQRPELAAINAADTRLAQWLGRFGLTPGDRARVVDLGSGEEQSPEGQKDGEFGAAAVG